MSTLYPHKEGDLTVEEAQLPYYRCTECDKVLNEHDRIFDSFGLPYCKSCLLKKDNKKIG